MVVTTKPYCVSGVVRNRVDGAPVEGIVVQAFDRDFFRDQALGVSITSFSGRYDIRFDRDDFTGPLPIERAPDIYLVCSDRHGRRLASTERSVVLDAGEDTRIDMVITVVKPVPKPAAPLRIAHIRGEPVDLVAAARLTGEEIVQTYRHLRGRAPAPQRFELIKEAFPLLKSKHIGDCGESRHAALRQIAREKGVFVLDRETDADDFGPGITVRSFYTEHILVRYTTDPADPLNLVDATVPAADEAIYLSDGTTAIGYVRANLADLDPANTEVAPAVVQRVGVIAENALTKYLGAPYNFRDPRNGAVRLEYRLLDQGSDFGSTNPAWSHVEIDPGLTPEQQLHSVPHEMFHQVQYRYHDTTTIAGFYSMLREGGCRLMEDCLDDASNRWVKDASAWFDNPLRSLQNGALLYASYHAGLFWKYVAEQHSLHTGPGDEPAIGVDSYRRALEQTATVQPSDPGLGYTLDALHQTFDWALPFCSSFDRFSWYSIPAGELSTHETTWGNFLVANALHAVSAPVWDLRFDYKEDDEPVLWSTSPVATLSAAHVFIDPANDLLLAPDTTITRNVTGQSPYAATYYRISPSGAPRNLRVTFTAGLGVTDPLIQIVRLGTGSVLNDIHRSDQASWTKTINMEGLTSVIVIAATRENGGDYALVFDEIASASDVMVTRWNTLAGQEFEASPRVFGWTWTSPDIMVDTDDDNVRDTDVFFGIDNTLKVRLRNRGNVTADNVQVQFWYQKATTALSPAAWIPLTDAAGTVQVSAPVSLAPGALAWVAVNWAPADDGTHDPHWCVKAQVISPGDANTDNKIALSNFTHVIEGADHDLSQLVRSLSLAAKNTVYVVPRGPHFTLVENAEPIGDRLIRARAAAKPRFDACEPDQITFVPYGIAKAKGFAEWNRRELTAEPQPQTFYPADPRMLPPGTKIENLVTLTHVADGRVLGGVTYEIVPRK